MGQDQQVMGQDQQVEPDRSGVQKVDPQFDFDDDAQTIVHMREPKREPKPASPAIPAPPALPFVLRRRKTEFDEHGWLHSLPTPAQAILRRATVPAPSWPIAPRVLGAVATPAHRIPSLRTNAS